MEQHKPLNSHNKQGEGRCNRRKDVEECGRARKMYVGGEAFEHFTV